MDPKRKGNHYSEKILISIFTRDWQKPNLEYAISLVSKGGDYGFEGLCLNTSKEIENVQFIPKSFLGFKHFTVPALNCKLCTTAGENAARQESLSDRRPGTTLNCKLCTATLPVRSPCPTDSPAQHWTANYVLLLRTLPVRSSYPANSPAQHWLHEFLDLEKLSWSPKTVL